MKVSVAKRRIAGRRNVVGSAVTLCSPQSGEGVNHCTSAFMASPDVPRAWRIAGADDAVSNHGVVLRYAAERRHPRVYVHHAGGHLVGGRRYRGLRRGGDGDSARIK